MKLGLILRAPHASRDIGLLLNQALTKIVFLAFGLLVDQWRWQVFNGQIDPGDYNKVWWALKLKYQGVAPPSPRGEQFFDPGAKYHAPLHRCSIYGSKAAADRLAAMMAVGLSRPWPEALEALTGSRTMDATAIRDYFLPLQQWLDQQLASAPVGW